MNTMKDLREELVERMKTTIHGREFDMMERSIRLPHMIGVTPVEDIHYSHYEDGTLLDVKHPFWQNYEEEIRTKSQVKDKLHTAINSLVRDGILHINHPKGKEADIVYVEVDDLDQQDDRLWTTCRECGERTPVALDIVCHGDRYTLEGELDCVNCGESFVLGVPLLEDEQ